MPHNQGVAGSCPAGTTKARYHPRCRAFCINSRFNCCSFSVFCKEVTSDGADFKSKVRDNLLLVRILGFDGWEKYPTEKILNHWFIVLYPPPPIRRDASLYKDNGSLNEKCDALLYLSGISLSSRPQMNL